jgi:hypothetical protein
MASATRHFAALDTDPLAIAETRRYDLMIEFTAPNHS